MKPARGNVIVQIHWSQKYCPMSEPNPGRSAGRHVLWLLLCLGLWSAAAAAADAPVLHTDSSKATAGYFRLTWDWDDPDNRRFQLQEGHSPAFAEAQTLYQGPDRASLLSGRRNGTYYYRVRLNPEDGAPGPWSEAVKIDVEHHSLGRAFTFFGVGAGVFLATLGLVVGGNLKTEH